MRSYSELIQIPSFEERFEYLKLDGIVGESTFGSKRYLNQTFYRSAEWKRLRDEIIIRDMGCDLGMEGFEIYDRILIHHLNPICADAIVHHDTSLVDPENLICVSERTHNAIHFGDKSLLPHAPVLRRPNDTCPWK